MTEKLFYEDSHRTEFTAKVISCEEAKDGFCVVLDQTAFFPEGGGQYADTGILGNTEVTDVHEKNDVIFHSVTAPLEVGSIVSGKINWKERFEKMQQHTGEHIVSGIVHERFGYNNVGFHLGADYCTMDFDGPISKAQLKEIEAAANEAVYRNLEVEVLYPSKEELKDMDYRSKIEIEGQVRIVKIPGYDVCACCAPHVKTTGEIGAVKLVLLFSFHCSVPLIRFELVFIDLDLLPALADAYQPGVLEPFQQLYTAIALVGHFQRCNVSRFHVRRVFQTGHGNGIRLSGCRSAVLI